MTQDFLSGNRDLLLQFLTRVRHSEQKVQLDVSEKRVCVRRPCCLKTKAQVLERLGAEMALGSLLEETPQPSVPQLLPCKGW